jgi:two-component system, LytTR family, sensor kinase
MQNKNEQTLGFNDFWFRLIGIPLIALVVPLVFFNRSISDDIYPISAFISFLYALLYWYICRKVFMIANQKYPSVEQNNQRIKYILIYCGSAVLLLCPLIHEVIEPMMGIHKNEFLSNMRPNLFQIYAANVTMHLAIASIYESIRNFHLWETTVAEKEKLEKEHVLSQLEGLKSQVNPHFLFNSLNTLISIIPEDSERSVRFVQQLAKIYRYFLETTDEKVVPLQREMDFVNSYTFLLKERFGESLHIDIDDKNACKDCQIIPFSLQLLLENGIKHNIISQDKPLYIHILVEKNYLRVKNNLQLKNQIQEGAGVGLRNIENRYSLLTKEKITIEKTEREFCVTLPLL